MKKVLFIDDERELHPIVTSYFPKEHYRVVCAGDGSEGMQKCRNEDFDIIIIDFKMPKIEGPKLFLLLQDLYEAKKAELPVIVFVTGAMEELKARNLKWGKSQFLEKPFQKEDLLQKIQQAYDEKTKPHSIKTESKVILNPGELLFQEGDDGNCMYYVVSGLLESCKKINDGNLKTIGKIGAGELVGEMAIIGSDKRLLTVKAVERTELIAISKEKVLPIVNAQPKWIKLIIENLGNRLKETIKQIP
ncbi:MAG: response regulator [Bacteriovoracia bacterium]